MGIKKTHVYSLGGGRLSVFKLFSSEGDCEVQKIDLSTTDLHSELNGSVQTVEESKEICDEFCGSVPANIEDVVSVTTPQENVGEEGVVTHHKNT